MLESIGFLFRVKQASNVFNQRNFYQCIEKSIKQSCTTENLLYIVLVVGTTEVTQEEGVQNGQES